MARPPLLNLIRITEHGLEEPLILNLDHVVYLLPISGGKYTRIVTVHGLANCLSVTMPFAEMQQRVRLMGKEG